VVIKRKSLKDYSDSIPRQDVSGLVKALEREKPTFKDMKWVESSAIETYYGEDGVLRARLKTQPKPEKDS